MPDFDESTDAIHAAREWLDSLGDGEIVDLWQAFRPRDYDDARRTWQADLADEAALKRAQARTDEDLRV